jgi:hypothetical protein
METKLECVIANTREFLFGMASVILAVSATIFFLGFFVIISPVGVIVYLSEKYNERKRKSL